MVGSRADCVQLMRAQEAEAAADAEVTKTEAAVRRIQDAAADHIAAQHEQLRQVQWQTRICAPLPRSTAWLYCGRQRDSRQTVDMSRRAWQDNRAAARAT